MRFKDLLLKLKSSTENKKYANRFLKFYHNNKNRLLKERKSLYHEKKKNGICVRCNSKVLEGIIFCDYHQQKQVGYNQQARSKSLTIIPKMKPNNPLEKYRKKNKKKKEDEWEIEPESDYPVHEKYTKEEPVKE